MTMEIEPVRDAAATATILVVDDEESVRRLLREILEGSDYRVLEAPNGIGVLKALDEDQVDLIVLDLVMPDQEGMETLRALGDRRPRPKILAISGAFGGVFLNCATSLGADAALKKPFSCEELLTNVQTLLDAGVAG